MFPGANADRDDAAYVVVGAPLDVSTTFQPGTRFGPDRIRTFSRPFDDYDHRTDSRFTDRAVHDAGDVRAWDDAPDYLKFLRGELEDVTAQGAVPLVLGGEHTVSVAGSAAADPDVLVVVDAHLDLRSEFDDNPWSHACTTRRILDGGSGDADREQERWPPSAERAVVLGARTGSAAEWKRTRADDVTVVPPEEVSRWVVDPPDLSGERVYLSVDVDAADPGFAPGTGTMEPFGLTPREMRDVVRVVAPHTVGFDVVEVNDRDDGQTAALAGKLLREFVYSHAAAETGRRQSD